MRVLWKGSGWIIWFRQGFRENVLAVCYFALFFIYYHGKDKKTIQQIKVKHVRHNQTQFYKLLLSLHIYWLYSQNFRVVIAVMDIFKYFNDLKFSEINEMSFNTLCEHVGMSKFLSQQQKQQVKQKVALLLSRRDQLLRKRNRILQFQPVLYPNAAKQSAPSQKSEATKMPVSPTEAESHKQPGFISLMNQLSSYFGFRSDHHSRSQQNRVRGKHSFQKEQEQQLLLPLEKDAFVKISNKKQL